VLLRKLFQCCEFLELSVSSHADDIQAANGGELLDDSAAFMKCSGNIAQVCGGPSVLSITSAYGDNIPSA
jgi:hypothetical protein